MTLDVAVVLGSLLAMRGMHRRPVAQGDGVAVSVGRTVLCGLTWRSAEGPAGGGFILVKGRTSTEGRLHARARVLQRKKYTRVGSTVTGEVPGISAQRVAGPHSTGDGGTVTGVGGRDSGHVCCATLLLTLSDSHALW